jgi:hypothetical protein
MGGEHSGDDLLGVPTTTNRRTSSSGSWSTSSRPAASCPRVTSVTWSRSSSAGAVVRASMAASCRVSTGTG